MHGHRNIKYTVCWKIILKYIFMLRGYKMDDAD